MRTSEETTLQEAIRRAEKLGKEHGENAAEWAAMDLWGGRFTGDSTSAAREFLRMAEDGDPVLWDRYKAPDLSGEYADGMTPERLRSHCFDSVDDYAECADAEDEICLAYEDAATSAFWQRLEESAANILER